MFDTAGGLVDKLRAGTIRSGEADLYSDTDQLLTGKLAESMSDTSWVHGSGVYRSIQDNGFQGHITMGGRNINEGHHRLAAAADIEAKTGKTQWIGLDHEGPTGHTATVKSYPDRYPQNPGSMWKDTWKP